MKINAECVNNVDSYLTECYMAGEKWVVFNTFGVRDTDDLKSFRLIQDAIHSCQNVMGSFNHIANVLRVLNPEKFKLRGVIDHNKISADISRLGLESRVKNDNEFDGLYAGDYYPVTLPMRIKPEAFESFFIMDHKYPSSMVYEEGHELQVAKTFPENAYNDAADFFEKYARNLDFSRKTRICGSYLIGKFKDQKPEYDYEGSILFNSAVLFKEAAHFTNLHTYETKFDIRTHADINNVVLKPSVLTRYNSVKGALEFFDDKMQTVELDKRILSSDIGRFYREKVEIKDGNNQRIKNDHNNDGPKFKI